MAVLDREAERLVEVHRVGHVEAVHVGPPQPARPRGDAPVPVVGVLEERVRRPRGVEVVLGARAVERRRPLLPVDEEHVVALAVPHDAGVVDVVVDADVVPLARDVGDQVVAVAGRVLALLAQHRPLVLAVGERLGELVVVPGVEAAEVGGQRSELGVVHVVVEGVDRLPGVVLDLDPRPSGERHREVAHHRPSLARPRREGEGGEGVALVPALPEEVADRRLDGGRRLPVPVHAQDDVVPAHGRRRGSDRHPDVGDDPRALHIEDVAAGARGDLRHVVAVAAGDVVAAHPLALRPRLEAGELEGGARHPLGECGGCSDEQGEGKSQGAESHRVLLPGSGPGQPRLWNGSAPGGPPRRGEALACRRRLPCPASLNDA